MKILIDTCVFLDVFENRTQFINDSMRVLKYVAEGKINGYITACSLKDIYYLVRKFNHSNEKTMDVLRSIVQLFDILDVNNKDAINAIESGNKDFEDALIIESAKRHQIDAIVTRNIADFKNSPIRILSPLDIK